MGVSMGTFFLSKHEENTGILTPIPFVSALDHRTIYIAPSAH